MRILVDGAAGLVGRHVVEALRARGLAVRATDVVAVPEWPDVERDRRDLVEAPLVDLFDGITHVVHAAGLFDLAAPRERLYAANVHATGRVARAALLAGVERFVHVSSVTVHGRPSRAPIDERAPCTPGNDYERSKAAGERALPSGLPAVILRPSGIYGPWSRYGVAAAICAMALAQERGRGHRSLIGGPRMTHAHVEDVASAAVHALFGEDMVGRAFFVADDQPLRWGDLMAHLERAIGLEPAAPIEVTPFKARWLGRTARLLPSRQEKTNVRLARAWSEVCERRDLARMLTPRIDASAYDYWSADHVYSIDALRRTGWSPRHVDPLASFTETIAWYRAHRWIP
jgi:nucleoside-diphosphate-sugar epimerase